MWYKDQYLRITLLTITHIAYHTATVLLMLVHVECKKLLLTICLAIANSQKIKTFFFNYSSDSSDSSLEMIMFVGIYL